MIETPRKASHTVRYIPKKKMVSCKYIFNRFPICKSLTHEKLTDRPWLIFESTESNHYLKTSEYVETMRQIVMKHDSCIDNALIFADKVSILKIVIIHHSCTVKHFTESLLINCLFHKNCQN